MSQIVIKKFWCIPSLCLLNSFNHIPINLKKNKVRNSKCYLVVSAIKRCIWSFLIAVPVLACIYRIFACVYRSPSALSLYALFETLSTFLPFYQNIVITGDFNPNPLATRKPETVIFRNLINTKSFSIVSTEPTHHLLHTNPLSHTTLDLFLVKNTESVLKFSKSDSPFIAGHGFIHLMLNIESPKSPPKTITCHRRKRINIEQLNLLISDHIPPTPTT